MRQELKYFINVSGQKVLSNYLKTFMVEDTAMASSLGYDVSSLYFDSPDLMCLSQKSNGDLIKQKFRIRFYDNKPTPIFLEVKSKNGSFSSKSRHAIANQRAPFGGSLEALSRFFDDLKPTSTDACDFLYNYHRFHLQPIL